MNNSFELFLRRLRAVVLVFVSLCFGYMLLAMLVQIASRYVFNYTVPGTEETALFAQIWMVLFGGGIAMRRGAHVAVDLLPLLLPLKYARWLALGLTAGALFFLGVVAYGSIALMQIGTFQTSPALRIPMWTIYLGIPFGCAYFACEVIMTAIERWNNPFGVVRSEID